jgi:hypothetical protein
MKRKLDAVRKALRQQGGLRRLPSPTHRADQVPYAKGASTVVTWLGVITHRNLRDIFELHFSRTGEELDPTTLRGGHPELNEYVVLAGQDDTETLALTIDRFKYPRFKQAVWGLKPDADVVLVRGSKPGNQARRVIYINDLWVFKEDDEDASD